MDFLSKQILNIIRLNIFSNNIYKNEEKIMWNAKILFLIAIVVELYAPQYPNRCLLIWKKTFILFQGTSRHKSGRHAAALLNVFPSPNVSFEFCTFHYIKRFSARLFVGHYRRLRGPPSSSSESLVSLPLSEKKKYKREQIPWSL